MTLLGQDNDLLRNFLKTKSKEEKLEVLSTLSDEDAYALAWDWQTVWARDDQIPPKELCDMQYIWLMLAGRGWGKTRTGAEFVRDLVYQGYMCIALVGMTPSDANKVMITGEGGLMSVFPPEEEPDYQPSNTKIIFHTGAVGHIYSGANPKKLRGPNHDAYWADELASWDYVEETYSNLMLTLRKPQRPIRGIITTTPQPIPRIYSLVKDKKVVVTRGSSYANIENLSSEFIETIKELEGTRKGRQEIYAELLDANPNALWNIDELELHRIPCTTEQDPVEELKARGITLNPIIIALDPNVSYKKNSDEFGIIVAGLGSNGECYILDDLSLQGTPDTWATEVLLAYQKYGASLVYAEDNQGGNMIEKIIKDRCKEPDSLISFINYKGVSATDSKFVRAEPVSSLYERGKVHHVGVFKKLEDELCEWELGAKSPNRLDALVWAVSKLMIKKKVKVKVKNTLGVNTIRGGI